MDYRSDRRFNGERDSVGYAVIYGYKFNAEAAETEDIAGLSCEDLRIVQQIVLFELELYESCRERCCVYGDIQLTYDIWDRADMILVTG